MLLKLPMVYKTPKTLKRQYMKTVKQIMLLVTLKLRWY